MEKTIQPATLLFLREGDRILLAMKKRGHGVGRWNGVGGKPAPGEDIRQTAVRECEEEIGVTPLDFTGAAILDFYFNGDKSAASMRVAVYICTRWRGEPVETEEMRPRWYDLGQIPYDEMWADDKYWLPRVLDGELLEGEFTFDDDDSLVDFRLEAKPVLSS